MTGVQKRAERRRHPRNEVRGATFVVLRPDYTMLGQVTDIGRGGLSFRYMAGTGSWDESRIMDIFVVGHDYYLDDVPFETVWDLPVAPGVPWKAGTLRRRGVRFGDLTFFQESQLGQLMENRFPEALLTRQNS